MSEQENSTSSNSSNTTRAEQEEREDAYAEVTASMAFAHAVYGVCWVPCSTRVAVVGGARTGGVLKVLRATDGLRALAPCAEAAAPDALRCVTADGACGDVRTLATGDVAGALALHDAARPAAPVARAAAAHAGAVHAIAGSAPACRAPARAPELATAGADGRVCVWDARTLTRGPVATIHPDTGTGTDKHECWAVAFGAAAPDVVALGTAAGTVALHDLRAPRAPLRRATGFPRGVAALTPLDDARPGHAFAALAVDGTLAVVRDIDTPAGTSSSDENAAEYGIGTGAGNVHRLWDEYCGDGESSIGNGGNDSAWFVRSVPEALCGGVPAVATGAHGGAFALCAPTGAAEGRWRVTTGVPGARGGSPVLACDFNRAFDLDTRRAHTPVCLAATVSFDRTLRLVLAPVQARVTRRPSTTTNTTPNVATE